jgi:hypothetical protein
MGWASASDIFDPVAQALIDAGVSDDVKRQVLGKLIDKLQAEDWDTEDESVDAFRDDPLIVSLFMERGVRASIDVADGYCQIDHSGGQWHLACCRDYSDVQPGTVEAHDGMVRAWVAHAAQAHGGDGRVPAWALIVPEGADR